MGHRDGDKTAGKDLGGTDWVSLSSQSPHKARGPRVQMKTRPQKGPSSRESRGSPTVRAAPLPSPTHLKQLWATSKQLWATPHLGHPRPPCTRPRAGTVHAPPPHDTCSFARASAFVSVVLTIKAPPGWVQGPARPPCFLHRQADKHQSFA